MLVWYPLARLHGLKQKYFQHCDITNCPAPRIENVPNHDTTVSYRTEPWILWTVTPLLSIWLSVCLSVCLSICLSIYLSIYLSICLLSGLWTVLCLFPVTQFFLHVDCLIWSQVCLLSSLVNLSLKAPVLSVSVCRSLNVIPCVPVSPVFSRWTIKCDYLLIPRLLVPGFLYSVCVVTEGPTNNSYLCVFPPFCLSFFPSVFFPLCAPWIPSFAPNSSSSCWSRGSVRSRIILDCF